MIISMWKYKQSTGELFDAEGRVVGSGYSGDGRARNKPELDHLVNRGPIPCGRYDIGPAYESPHSGIYTLFLQALPGNEARGRGGFLIQGDLGNPTKPSHGCIVLPRAARMLLDSSADRELEVIP